jgi:hypothetical protein
MRGERAINKPNGGTAVTAPLHLLVLAVAFAMVGVCTGLALQAGASPLATVTLRTLGTLVLFSAYFAAAGVRFSIPPREVALAIAIGLPLALNNYLINAAFADLPVPLVVLLFYLWPGITAAVSWLLGIEAFRWRGLAGLVLAFAGIAMALNVDFTAAQTKGVLYAMAAAVNWTVVFLLMGRFFRGRDTRAPTFYMSCTAAAVLRGHRGLRAAALGSGMGRHARHDGFLRVRHDRHFRRQRALWRDAQRLLAQLRADRRSPSFRADPWPDAGAGPARGRRAGRVGAVSVSPAGGLRPTAPLRQQRSAGARCRS